MGEKGGPGSRKEKGGRERLSLFDEERGRGRVFYQE